MKLLFKRFKRWLFNLLFLIRTRVNTKPRSKGEREVIEYLTKHKIKFKRELRIKCNTSFQRNLYVDFVIPSLNTYIEYNGKQHYEPVKKFGGEVAFARQIKRDEWLRDYCKKKGIKLIEISYKDNVESVLNDELLVSKSM